MSTWPENTAKKSVPGKWSQGVPYISAFMIQPSTDFRLSETDSNSDNDDNNKLYKYQDPPTSGNESNALNSEESDHMTILTAPGIKGKKLKKKKAKFSELIGINVCTFANLMF